jgi:hypothetical protein
LEYEIPPRGLEKFRLIYQFGSRSVGRGAAQCLSEFEPHIHHNPVMDMLKADFSPLWPHLHLRGYMLSILFNFQHFKKIFVGFKTIFYDVPDVP